MSRNHCRATEKIAVVQESGLSNRGRNDNDKYYIELSNLSG